MRFESLLRYATKCYYRFQEKFNVQHSNEDPFAHHSLGGSNLNEGGKAGVVHTEKTCAMYQKNPPFCTKTSPDLPKSPACCLPP